ncbi:hypothetical protein BDZ45DRAFT_493920 [Acephala macrosclerotiorum]|nr:hypothetical protein BDZ45DRAFT_493920 [Acephala macrosclerotiorum]
MIRSGHLFRNRLQVLHHHHHHHHPSIHPSQAMIQESIFPVSQLLVDFAPQPSFQRGLETRDHLPSPT